jgi:CRP-like cAMP-binding protein
VSIHADLTVDEIFEGLSPKTVQDFRALGRKVSYPSGTTLIAAGKACTGVFWLSSGQVRVSFWDNHGAGVVSRIAKAGEILGLKAALCDEPYGITARTEKGSEGIFVSRDRLSEFLSNHADVAFRIVQQLSDRVGVALDQLRSVPGLIPRRLPN